MSLATQAVATATSEYWVSVTDVVVDAVCFVRNTAVEVVVTSSAKQFQPVVAAGKPITPDVAVPPVPTLMRNAAVPLLAVTEGEVPKPEEIVGAVEDTSKLVVVNVAAFAVVNVPAAAAVPPIAGGEARYVLKPVPETVLLAVTVPAVIEVTVGVAEYAGATPTPPDTSTEPVATSESLLIVVEAEA